MEPGLHGCFGSQSLCVLILGWRPITQNLYLRTSNHEVAACRLCNAAGLQVTMVVRSSELIVVFLVASGSDVRTQPLLHQIQMRPSGLHRHFPR
jgi:hypothetical protein